jgi:hypothetical protein
MNRNRVPNGPTLVASCLALGALSGLCSWLALMHGSSFAPYLPGALLGFFVCIGGQYTLGWPRLQLTRAATVVFVCLVAWRLAPLARQLGGPLPWVNASVVGALGILAGMFVAWPQPARRTSPALLMTAAGWVGGLLFTAASELHWVRSGRSLSAMLLLCSWQAGLLTAAALALRLPLRA